jgi:hypothetical protein
MTPSGADRPTLATRALCVVGILGGLGLLAAFVVEIPSGWNPLRLVLFNAGALAVALAAYRPHAAVSRRLALAGTIPIVVANTWAIAWTLLAIGRESPFSGDFGLVGFWGGLAAWLADAWFGIVALRIGVLWRPATTLLAVGSLLAITGMDRLELTSQANPTVFSPISLAGIALNGIAWILLGLEIAVPRLRVMRFPGGW